MEVRGRGLLRSTNPTIPPLPMVSKKHSLIEAAGWLVEVKFITCGFTGIPCRDYKSYHQIQFHGKEQRVTAILLPALPLEMRNDLITSRQLWPYAILYKYGLGKPRLQKILQQRHMRFAFGIVKSNVQWHLVPRFQMHCWK